MLRSVLAALPVMLLFAAPAAAAPLPIRDDLAALGVALSGPDVVIAREIRKTESLQVVALPRTGGAPRVLLDVASAQLQLDEVGRIAASDQRVAFIAEINDKHGQTKEYRFYT